MKSYTFSWGASLITAAAFVLLVGLGLWQLQRLEWKQSILTDISTAQDRAPLRALPDDITKLDYQRVELTGLLDRAAALKLGLRTYQGKSGYHWVVPMIVAADTPGQGHVVLVNLGWVPQDYVPPDNASSNIETITGVLRAPQQPGWMAPTNPATGPVIHWIDLSSISDRLDTPIYPYVLEADKSGDNPPIGGQALASLPNNHLQYAITWFVLAGCVLVIFFLASRNKDQGDSAA